MYAALQNANPHLKVYAKGEVPARFHFNDNPRITPLVLVADVLGRVVLRPGELPVGIVTAFIGAPVLVALARRKKVSGL